MKKEIIKPFDLEAYKYGAKIQTRNGHEVRIICTDAKRPSYPVVALVKVDNNRECIISYTTEGKEYYSSADSDPNDLVIVEEVEESEFWTDKEDNDEKIRKVLVDYFKIYKEQEECGIKTFYGIPADDILAWLEKQGTQPRYNIGDILCDLSCNEYDKDSQLKYEIIDIKNGTYICDNGSIPVSQQDEYKLVAKKAEQKPVKVNNDEDSVSNELREASFIFAARQMVHKASPEERKLELIYSFEEGAKWQAARKSSWSKDDDDNIAMVESRLYDLLNYTREDGSLTKHRKESIKKEVNYYVSWLKSIKDRCTWKPSDEQMEVLLSEVKGWKKGCSKQKVLESLYQDLKKLK